MATPSNQSFLSSLGLPEGNPANYYQQGLGPIETRNPLGRGAGLALAGLLRGFVDRKENGGFSFKKGVQGYQDRVAAQGADLPYDTYQTRREILEEMNRQDFGDKSQIENQIAMSEWVVRKASEKGDSSLMAQALQKVDQLRREKEEWDALQSSRVSKSIIDKAEADEAGVFDVYLKGETKPRAAKFEKREDGSTGVTYINDEGQATFAPVGQYSREDPNSLKGDDEPLDVRMRRTMKSGELERIKNKIVTGLGATRKFDRVMSSMTDLYKHGGVEQVISSSGQAVRAVTDLYRNIRGFAGAFISNDEDRKSGILTRWLRLANDPNDPIWKQLGLSDELLRTGAEATQHRARIMELAYMAARLAEPSNRGLSDKDITNALDRIAGNTTNPQVMLRRFIELMADGYEEVDDELLAWHGMFNPYTDDEIDQVLGGAALPKFRQKMGTLYKKYDVSFDDSGRARFADPIDADIQPGEGVHAPAKERKDMDDDEFLKSILGNGSQ